MDPTHIGLFDLAEQRLAWTDQRQAVLAQNIANANTPGYKPHDLQSFAAALADVQRGGTGAHPAQPSGRHARRAPQPDEVVDRTHAQSPDGNAVALDEQLMKVADTETHPRAGDHDLQEIPRHVQHWRSAAVIG